MYRAIAIFLSLTVAGTADAADLRVLAKGLGSGTIRTTGTSTGIDCGGDCDESYAGSPDIELEAVPDPGSIFVRWESDASGTSATTTVTVDTDKSVRAVFDLDMPIPTMTSITPAGIQAYLLANPIVTTPARFVEALPPEYRVNWIPMTRSESLQTGTAKYPRLLLPSVDGQNVFTIGLEEHPSFPGSHPSAIEYMQWDGTQTNFRFHEIVLNPISELDHDADGDGVIPERLTRGVTIDDPKCFNCHSTQNIPNDGPDIGTTGITPGSVKAKAKPNWDTYDSWAGMLPFNRDRIYKGSIEAAAFRAIFNPWTWSMEPDVRQVIELLDLQPSGVSASHTITRTVGGPNDGHVNFPFDDSPPVLSEPTPSGTGITSNYGFDGVAGAGAGTDVVQNNQFVRLQHSSIPTSDEGRGVRFFDVLGGAQTPNLNALRIMDELTSHRWGTGSVPVEVRPITLAIAKKLIRINGTSGAIETTTATPLLVDTAFFNARNGMDIIALRDDTRDRAYELTRRKADFQMANLTRRYRDGSDFGSELDQDPYVEDPTNGLLQEYGAATDAGVSIDLSRVRQEVFRRPTAGFSADRTVMGGVYVDREDAGNIDMVALFRYFLEPLGVSVDKWSMGVRGRSRSYTFADVFVDTGVATYIPTFLSELPSSLVGVEGLSAGFTNEQLMAAVNSSLSSLPAVDDTPTFTDVQRIFNKSCVECHGGLDYPPYGPRGAGIDFTEREEPLPGEERLTQSHALASAYATGFMGDPLASTLYTRITNMNEHCLDPDGVMPCGGPALSECDVETIARWITGPPARAFTHGDPHLRTVDGIRYDFQADGEFTLLRDIGFELQARQAAVETDRPLGPNAHTGLTTCVSINTAVAVRLGRQRITYQPDGKGDRPQLVLRVDGTAVSLGSLPLALDRGARIIRTEADGGIQIEDVGGAELIITPGFWNRYGVWYLNIDARGVRAKRGLMGTVGPGQWLPALPDGRRLGPKPDDLESRYHALYDVLGEAWRVTDDTSLFDYAPGSSTASFTVDEWPSGPSEQQCPAPPNRAGGAAPAPITQAEAERLCGDIVDGAVRENCIVDVMATGEPTFAATYIASDRIVQNRAPSPPVLVEPDDFGIVAGPKVTFEWQPSVDPDGDRVTYRHLVWSVNDLPTEVVGTTVDGSTPPWLLWLALFLLLLGIFLLVRRVLIAGVAVLGLGIVLAVVALGQLRAAADPGDPARFVVDGLVPGEAYYWKVIAEDEHGRRSHAINRKFEMQP